MQVDVPGMENESDRYLILYKMIYTFMFYVMVSNPPFTLQGYLAHKKLPPP